MLMDLFVSTWSEICSESGEGWAVLTLLSFGCNFTPKDRTLRGRLTAPKGLWGFQKSSCNNQNSMVLFLLEKGHSRKSTAPWIGEMGNLLDLHWAVLELFWWPLRLENLLLSSTRWLIILAIYCCKLKMLFLPDWGLFFLEAPQFEAVEQFIFSYENNNLIFPCSSWDCLEEVVTCALEFRPVKPLTLSLKSST